MNATTIKKITEVDTPIIGQKYLVPCYLVNSKDRSYSPQSLFFPDGWIPVLVVAGTHADADLGVEDEHLHFDTRFIARNLVNMSGLHYTAAIVQVFRQHWDWEQLESLRLIQWRVRKCFRDEQVFPQSHHFMTQVNNAIAPNYKNHVMGGDWVCPHRGMCLKGWAVKQIANKRVVTCPGHGLIWDADTGGLISGNP